MVHIISLSYRYHLITAGNYRLRSTVKRNIRNTRHYYPSTVSPWVIVDSEVFKFAERSPRAFFFFFFLEEIEHASLQTKILVLGYTDLFYESADNAPLQSPRGYQAT